MEREQHEPIRISVWLWGPIVGIIMWLCAWRLVELALRSAGVIK